MEQFHVQTLNVKDGRNKSMHRQFFGEASPITGTTAKLAAELRIVRMAGELLAFHYPGHPFSVEANSDQGFLKIGLPPLFGSLTWNLPLDKHIQPKDVINAGGAMLERFNVPRSTIDIAAYIAAEQKMPGYTPEFGANPFSKKHERAILAA